jgi:probable rRNA maturation factor
MYRHAIDVRFSPEISPAVEKNWLRGVARRALQLERLMEQAELSIILTTDEEVRRLNREYRGIDAPTDVLSFPMGAETTEGGQDAFLAPEGVRMLGDVVISYPQAVRQAVEYGHSLQREVGFLTVHGILHLLGLDHETPEEERVMFAKQEEVLASLGLTRAPAAS